MRNHRGTPTVTWAIATIVALACLLGPGAGMASASSNPIVAENQQPGTTSWQFTNFAKATNHEIEGYASLTSVNQGGQIQFMVSTSASAQYNMDFYRMGWYPTGTNPDGTSCAPSCGGRLMLHVGSLTGFTQATCPQDTNTSDATFGMTECHWTPTYSLTVPSTWTTGVYLVKLTRLDDGLQNYMTFVVRDDGDNAPTLYSLDVNTWQAYNFWGGAGNKDVGYDLYGKFNDVSQASLSSARGYTVSFDRPYMDQGSEDGAGNFMNWDFPMIRWMESQGYNIDYVTDVDLDNNPSVLNGHQVFVNTGHDEYYSDAMRSRIQNGIASGVNMAFFSANNIYQRVVMNPDYAGASDRRVFDDKGALPGSTTNQYRYLNPPQPENAIDGVMQNGVASNEPFLVYDANNWIYAGTGLVSYTGNGTSGVVTSGPGQNALPGVVGYEFDERAANDPSLSSFVPYEPAGLQQVGHSYVPAADNGVQAWSDATLYTAPSGAMVFSAGTIEWSFAVDNGYNDGWCSDCNHNVASAVGQRITANILNRFTTPSTAPAVSLSPSSLSFGSQAVGSTSAPQSVTLTNSGTAALSISSIAISGTNAGDFTESDNCPPSSSTLAAGASCTVNVTFSPGAAGSRAASVRVSDNASDSPQSVALSGTGTAPSASLSPSSLSFGSQLVGTTSSAQSVTLTNSGNAALSISNIAVSGTNSGDFTETDNCPTGSSTLAAGSSCTISVTFTPSATGARSASVQLSDNANGSPQSVTLTGTGQPPGPAVSLSPGSLSFGSQSVGSTSAAQSVTLKNSGTSDLSISSIGVGGSNVSDFTETDNCPKGASTLAAGSSCTISVTFSPSTTGARSASVQVNDNAPDSPQSVALSGTGTAPGVSLSPSSLSFGSQVVGKASAAQSVTLTDSGTAPLSIGSVAVSGTNAGDFAQTNTCPTGASTLAAGASCTISVTFTPGATGARSASLQISDNASSSPQTVPLSGTGVGAIALDKTLGQRAQNTLSSTIKLTTTAAAASGTRVFAFVEWYGGGTTLSSLSGGGLTWSVDIQAQDSTGYHTAIASASAPNGLPASSVLTATISGLPVTGLLSAASFTGISASSPLDAKASNLQNGVRAWTDSVTTTNANDLVLGWSGIDKNTTNTPTAPNVEIFDFSNGAFGEAGTAEYQVVSTAGTKTVSGTWGSSSGSTANSTVAAAYKAS
jgi:hypothetical protein